MRAALATVASLLFAAQAARAQPAPQPAAPAPQGPALSASGPDQKPSPASNAAPAARAPAVPPIAAPPPPPPAPPPPALAAGLARITGKVTIAGLAPRLAPVPVSSDMKICGTSKQDEALVIGPGGGIRDVVLWIEGLPAPKRKPGEKAPRVKLDQHACQFMPHVVVAPVGAVLDIVNSDSVLHNVHARVGETTLFNYAMPIKGYVIPRKLDKVELVQVSCDVHPWMHALIDVLPTAAFAATDAYGSYFIDVPPGKYTLKVKHERLGEREEQVEVAAGQTLQHDVSLTPR